MFAFKWFVLALFLGFSITFNYAINKTPTDDDFLISFYDEIEQNEFTEFSPNEFEESSEYNEEEGYSEEFTNEEEFIQGEEEESAYIWCQLPQEPGEELKCVKQFDLACARPPGTEGVDGKKCEVLYQQGYHYHNEGQCSVDQNF